jgi:hypothetical protein
VSLHWGHVSSVAVWRIRVTQGIMHTCMAYIASQMQYMLRTGDTVAARMPICSHDLTVTDQYFNTPTRSGHAAPWSIVMHADRKVL